LPWKPPNPRRGSRSRSPLRASGLGKTTLATIIANELDVGFQQTSGPALQIQGDLTAILTNLRERQVLFLDEIHRMQPVLEEKLYTAWKTTSWTSSSARDRRRAPT